MTELNKPNYYAAFKGSYELVYLEPESEEWLNLHEKWCNFIKRMNAMELWKRLPWYKKLYYKIRFKFDMFE
ncbi:hypothetical protein SBF1_8800003 [Candidatus Desulfosporosinus infrequens]|uniref:Uncharacterized protein n=1 Tax=Candidatus Desulfosporosinus infrequens TaxID=2043169 RepID=A0A2U3LW70_9FIRM|nr:hypothetical protein SBF1_8800003 [Candidatus Desulfosporosinus infrequens]